MTFEVHPPGPLFLGLDGGGTKTAAVIIDSAGIEVGRGLGGPCNIATSDDASFAALSGALVRTGSAKRGEAGSIATDSERAQSKPRGVAGSANRPLISDDSTMRRPSRW